MGSAAAATLHYAASAEHAPGSLGTLTITANGEHLTYPITGGVLTGILGSYPASVDFGSVCADTATAKTMPVMLFANGTSDVQISLATPPTQSPFGATLTNHVLKAKHNGEEAVTVSVKPDGTTPLGAQTTTLDVDTDIPNQGTYPIALSAYVVPTGIAATPQAVDFGGVMVGTSTSGKHVVFSNCGDGSSLMVTGAHIAGANASSFTIISPETIATTLGDAQSEDFLITMVPGTSGPQVAQLVIENSSRNVTVPLTGAGDEPEKDRQTYYACSTGHATSAWPIGLALLALRRRRR
jgi:hypothetical protein